jgi:hypothetical protein
MTGQVYYYRSAVLLLFGLLVTACWAFFVLALWI